MLLYAKTQEAVVPNGMHKIHGNTFYVRTLDLNCDFFDIRRQLNEIAAGLLPNGNQC